MSKQTITITIDPEWGVKMLEQTMQTLQATLQEASGYMLAHDRKMPEGIVEAVRRGCQSIDDDISRVKADLREPWARKVLQAREEQLEGMIAELEAGP